MSRNTVYAGNLSWDTDEARLREVFGQFGEIVSCDLKLDRETGRSRGFGFVTFKEFSSAQDCIKLNGTTVDDRQIRVSFAKEDKNRTGGDGGQRGGFQQRDRGNNW